jgi:hypothetical protein
VENRVGDPIFHPIFDPILQQKPPTEQELSDYPKLIRSTFVPGIIPQGSSCVHNPNNFCLSYPVSADKIRDKRDKNNWLHGQKRSRAV